MLKFFGSAVGVTCFMLGAGNLMAGSNIFGQAHSHWEEARWVMIGLMSLGMGALMWWSAGKL